MEFPVGIFRNLLRFMAMSGIAVAGGFFISMSPSSAAESLEYSLEAETSTVTERQLLRTTSDAAPGHMDLKLILDSEKGVLGFRAIDEKNTVVAEVKSEALPQGVVVLKRQGYDIVKVRSERFDVKEGGEIEVIYLTNGLKKEYATFKCELVRHGDRWVLQVNDNAGRREFTQMFMEARKMLGQVIGIKRLIVK